MTKRNYKKLLDLVQDGVSDNTVVAYGEFGLEL